MSSGFQYYAGVIDEISSETVFVLFPGSICTGQYSYERKNVQQFCTQFHDEKFAAIKSSSKVQGTTYQRIKIWKKYEENVQKYL